MITLKIKKNTQLDEYCVAYIIDGRKDEAKSYYTDNFSDAIETKKAMQREVDLLENAEMYDEPEFVPAPEIEIESAYPEVKNMMEVANEIIAEYNHGTAEFADCAGVTGKQYAAVIQDFLLYMNSKKFEEDREHFKGWVKE